MKTTGKVLILCAALLATGRIVAQESPESFMKQLPPLPENICNESSESMAKWFDRLSALKGRMEDLNLTEKRQREEALAAAQPNLELYEPSNQAAQERLRKVMDELAAIDLKSGSIIDETVSPFLNDRNTIIDKYHTMLQPLYNERGEAIAGGRNDDPVRAKILRLEQEQCHELALIRGAFLTKYRGILNELVAYGIRADSLVDEVNRMSYKSYTFKIRYGFWLEYIIAYADDLMKIFDDNPDNGPGKEEFLQ